MSKLMLESETFKIFGACFEVYKEVGCGFRESVYQECLRMEFAEQGVPFSEQKQLELRYKDQALQQIYKPDFICFDQVIVELKAVTQLADERRAQLINYLRATGLKVGLLVNFGHHPKLEDERIVC